MLRQTVRSVVSSATRMARSPSSRLMPSRRVASFVKPGLSGRGQGQERKLSTAALVATTTAAAAGVGIVWIKSKAGAGAGAVVADTNRVDDATTPTANGTVCKPIASTTAVVRAKSDGKVVWYHDGAVLHQYLPSKDEIVSLRLSASSTFKVKLVQRFKGDYVRDNRVMVLLHEVDENGMVLQTIPVYFNLSIVPASIVSKERQNWYYHEEFVVDGSDFEDGRLAVSIVAKPSAF